jgi:hypothetical protein
MIRRLRMDLMTVLACGAMSALLSAQKNAMPPQTPWGEPDLQGTWTNQTLTPLERPASMADKRFYTKEEALAAEQRAAEQRVSNEDAPPRPGDVGTYNRFWAEPGTRIVGSLATSLVVEPSDGRVPLQRSAEQRRDDYLAHESDSFDFMSPWDRCITRGIPGAFFPAGYNNAYQIVQSRGYVVIHYEMIHAARVIPTDGRSHLPSTLRFWDGDSVGHWEGNTLVVDITNYNGKGWIATNGAAGRIKGIPQSDALHVVERFTRTNADTIDYRVTIDDPKVYTKPWTAAIPLNRDESYQIFEYACHEGNKAVEDVLRGGRAEEKQPAGRTPR